MGCSLAAYDGQANPAGGASYSHRNGARRDSAHQAAPRYFNVRKTSIYGGSNEIQRNIIAKMVLGL